MKKPIESDKEPALNPDFTEKLVKRLKKQHIFQEFVFSLVMGFREILSGFVKIDTMKNHKEEED